MDQIAAAIPILGGSSVTKSVLFKAHKQDFPHFTLKNTDYTVRLCFTEIVGKKRNIALTGRLKLQGGPYETLVTYSKGQKETNINVPLES